MKKLFATLLAVIMLALPVMSLAASPAEMLDACVNAGRPLQVKWAFEYGSMPFLDQNTEAIVKDVINALGFTAAHQGGDTPQIDLAMQLSGVDVLTFTGAQKGEEFYLKSNLLGNDVLAMSGEEAMVVVEYLLNMAQEAGVFTAQELEETKKAMAEAIASVGSATVTTEMDDLDAAALEAAAAKLMEKAQIENNPAQPKNSDAAAKAISFSLTGEDIAQVYDAMFDMMKSNEAFMSAFESGFKSGSETMTAEEFLAQAPEAMREVTAMIQGEVPVVIYLDAEEQPVYGTASLTMASEGETITMDMNYARLTVNEGVTHSASLIGEDNTNGGVACTFSMLQSPKRSTASLGVDSIENGVSSPVINVAVSLDKEYGENESESEMDIDIVLTDGGEEIGMKLEIEQSAEKVGESDVKCDAEIDVFVLDMEKELFSIEVKQITGEAAESIVVADVVRPGAMTEDEFQALLDSVANTAMMALINLVQNLPSSVLMLMLEM